MIELPEFQVEASDEELSQMLRQIEMADPDWYELLWNHALALLKIKELMDDGR